MSLLVTLTADILVAILLVATIVSSVRLSRRIVKLKADETALRQTIGDLIMASSTAERAIAGLRATLDECDRTLADRLGTAERYAADLAAHVAAGESVITRISAIVSQAVPGRPIPRTVQPIPLVPERRADPEIVVPQLRPPAAAVSPNGERIGAAAAAALAMSERALGRPAQQSRMKKPGRLVPRREQRPFKLRLIDAVTLAAAGLLILKLSAIALEESRPVPGSPLPDFARVLAKARTGYEPADPTTTGSVTPKEPEKAAPEPEKPVVRAPPPPEPMPASERAILERLSARRDTLKQRGDALDLREQLLGSAERKLEEGVDVLKQGEGKAEGGPAQRAEAEKAGLKNIVTMYETMKPKDAARVFDRLSLEVLVPIVLVMNPRKMAEVLALMQSEPAEKLTVALANRARGQNQAQPPAVSGLGPNELQAIDPGGKVEPRR